MRFLMENIYKDIKGKKTLNAILLFLFLIGMLVPLGSVSLVKNMWDNYGLSEYPEQDRLVVAEYFETVKPEMEETFYTSMKDMAGVGAEQVGVMVSGTSIVAWEDSTASVMMAGCTQDFVELCSCMMVEGEGPDILFGTDEYLCLIQNSSQMYADGVGVGEQIRIDNTVFTVAGVVHFPMLYGDVMLSFERAAELKEGSRLQQQVLLQLPQPAKITKIRAAAGKWFQAAGKEALEVTTGEKKAEVYRKSIEESSGQKLTAAALLLLFTMISFFSVVSGMLAQERKVFGIRLAFGASFQKLKWEIILRMELLLGTACLLDGMIYPLVFAGLKGVSRQVSLQVFLSIWLIFAAVVWMVSQAVLKRFLRKDGVTAMLKEGL